MNYIHSIGINLIFFFIFSYRIAILHCKFFVVYYKMFCFFNFYFTSDALLHRVLTVLFVLCLIYPFFYSESNRVIPIWIFRATIDMMCWWWRWWWWNDNKMPHNQNSCEISLGWEEMMKKESRRNSIEKKKVEIKRKVYKSCQFHFQWKSLGKYPIPEKTELIPNHITKEEYEYCSDCYKS